MRLIRNSKELMLIQTKKNKAPAWLLTEIAVEKGKELSKKFNVNEELIVTSLYLAHTVFSPFWKDKIQKNHPKLSAEFVRKFLVKWDVGEEEQDIILDAIMSHHSKDKPKTKISEIVRNAEGFKFLSIKGALVFLHELGKRGFSYEESLKMLIEKMDKKFELLTLDVCINDARKNKNEILNLLKK
jgi:hypothetical protein